jgi:hypothetical protein
LIATRVLASLTTPGRGRLLLDCFDVAAGRALIGNELGHRTDARHAADRRWAFAQARTVLGQILKLDRHAAKLTVPGKRYNSGMFLKEHLIRSGVLTLFAAKPAPSALGAASHFSQN